MNVDWNRFLFDQLLARRLHLQEIACNSQSPSPLGSPSQPSRSSSSTTTRSDNADD